MRGLVLAAVLGLGVVGASAQAGAPAAGAMLEPSKALDSALTQFEGEFMGAAKAMPAEKYTFTPASLNIPGANYAGVKTFAQEVTHVTQANYYIYSGVMGSKPDVDVKAIGTLTDKEAILKALAASFAYAHRAIATVTVANENQLIPGGQGSTRYGLAAYGPAHGFDHYGQMVEYLRMNGIVPPASAK